MNNKINKFQSSQNIQLGPKIERVFDYDRVDESQLKLAKEIISVLREHEKLSISEVIKILERRFKFKEVPTIDAKNSVWHNLTQSENIKGNIQGYMFKKDENGDDIKVPIVCFSEPLDKLDNFIQNVIKKTTK